MKRCKHERAWAWRWTGDGWATIATIAPSISFGDRMTCVDCGAWLSLGPARDDGEHAQAVAVEIRAAELAALVESRGVVLGVAEFYLDEAHGWRDQQDEDRGGDCACSRSPGHLSRNWHAGYLARAICEHTEES